MKTKKFEVPEQFVKNPPLFFKLVEAFLQWLKTERYPNFFQEAEDATWKEIMSLCVGENGSVQRALLRQVATQSDTKLCYQARALLMLMFHNESYVDVTSTDVQSYKYILCFDSDDFSAFCPELRAMCIEVIAEFMQVCEQVYRRPKEGQHSTLELCVQNMLLQPWYKLSSKEKRIIYEACPVWVFEDRFHSFESRNKNIRLNALVAKKVQWLIQNSTYLDQSCINSLASQYWREFVTPYQYLTINGKKVTTTVKKSLAEHMRFIAGLDASVIDCIISDHLMDSEQIVDFWHMLDEDSTYMHERGILARMGVEHFIDTSTDFLKLIRFYYIRFDWVPAEWYDAQWKRALECAEKDAYYMQERMEQEEYYEERNRLKKERIAALLEKIKK